MEIIAHPDALALEPQSPDIVARAIGAANEIAGPVQGVVSVSIDRDAALRDLNRQWRQMDKPTNVLSFPAPASPQVAPRQWGDIAISYETTAREAAEEGKPFADHLAHLAVHGFLHLLGYDHESDHDAEKMEAAERAILARVSVPDPYAAREIDA
ncbi:MAG: rRNA maturation RNase YbeY [Pseudorhodoplanes sp.]|nr:rRNA maturation RNase YbeY [Pseudorhodoplanes sp.]